MRCAPCAGPWGVLPLVVREQLHLGAAIYGTLLGLMGIGGVTAGLLLPQLRSLLHARAPHAASGGAAPSERDAASQALAGTGELRPLVVLVLACLMQALLRAVRRAQLTSLLVQMCGALRSRLQPARDAACQTLERFAL